MLLTPLDWAILGGYAVFVIAVGVFFARRAGRDVDQFFLSGRTLPWWLAGTSMVATTFASDTPLVITGWVRDHGIWQNWLWWCLAGGGMLTVFLFARYWRRGGVMTTAEMAELRYGGAGARALRGFLGTYQALITNTIILCWVILAAAKIMDVLFEVDKVVSVGIACALALTYSSLAGFWGVVTTDLVQFTMAMVGAIALAVLSWEAIGGGAGLAAAQAAGELAPGTLSLLPPAGAGTFLDAGFWTASLATVALYMGVTWWANDQVDGGSLAVQRIAACRSERDGVLAALWYNIAHYSLRPWPWIVVALASLIVLPTIEVRAPQAGTVTAVESAPVQAPEEGAPLELRALTITRPAAAADADPAPSPDAVDPAGGSAAAVAARVDLDDSSEADWAPALLVEVGDEVEEGQLIARTDSERAYVVMLRRFLPPGLLGIAVASLLAAFMSTVDTHVNLASSFFVNDIYRRFFVRGASERHYVAAARVSSALVLGVAGGLAWLADSISDLFTFFMSFLSGVGPVYVLRWLWWRVRASTEILAILTSSVTATYLTFGGRIEAWTGLPAMTWPDTLLSPDGVLGYPGRVCIVVAVTALIAFGSLLLLPRPDPARLVDFYRKVRPTGAWGPVRSLCPDVPRRRAALPVAAGFVGGLMTIYGLLFAIGHHLLGAGTASLSSLALACVGALLMVLALRELGGEPATGGAPEPTLDSTHGS